MHTFTRALLPALIAGISQATLAHHSTAAFDTEQSTAITGQLVRYQWANPHVYLWLETESDEGTVTWEVEGQPPAILKRLGWTRETVSIGERLTITGSPGREVDKHTLLMRHLEKPGSDSLSMGSREVMQELSQSSDEEFTSSGLAGTWTTIMDMRALGPVMSPQDEMLTEKGRQAQADFVEATDSPSLQCIPFAPPVFMLTPDTKQVRVIGHTIVISGEFDGVERVIHMDRDSHDNATDSWLGHSIGRWEGKTLVIDTTHFTPHRSGITFGVPSGAGKHMVERLSLNDAGTHLNYSFELTDEEYLVDPMTANSTQWQYRPDIEFEALPCNLENARRFMQ